MKIYAPVKDFNGLRNNVRFVNGVGETDNPSIAEWFRSHGYSVEKCDNSHENPLEKGESPRVEQATTVQPEIVVEDVGEVNQPYQPDFESMTPNELREWAKANGFGTLIRNTRSKEKLLEIIRG